MQYWISVLLLIIVLASSFVSSANSAETVAVIGTGDMGNSPGQKLADIVLLAAPWPAMEQVAQNLGNLDGTIVIDVSFPFEQGTDGYPQSSVETSSAEMIQVWPLGTT